MVDESRRCDSLACARRALNQSQWRSQCLPHGIHLESVEFGQALHRESLGNLNVNVLLRSAVTEDFVEDVIRDRGLVFQEDFESLLHSVEGCRFPHKLDDEAVVTVLRDTFLILDIQADFFAWRNFDDVSTTLPLDLAVNLILKFELITWYQAHVVFIRKHEEGHLLLCD